MVIALTDAHREILKELFECSYPEILRLKAFIFDYLMYIYLNEKLTVGDSDHWKTKYRNLILLLSFLSEKQIQILFKLKYVPELYSMKNVKNDKIEGFTEHIYWLKLAVLKYLAKTGQITRCANSYDFLNSWTQFKTSVNLRVYQYLVIKFFMYLSSQKDF